MKTVSKIVSLAFVVMISFSCGKSDPTPTPHQQIIQKTWTIPIKGFQGQSVSLPNTTISLSEIPGIDAANFVSGEFQNSGSYIKVSGLSNLNDVVLNNLTLQVNTNTAVNFGTCTAKPSINDFGSDVEQSGNKELQFLNSLFGAYAAKGKTATLKVSFIPSGDVTDNVNLIIAINGKYNWNTFDK